MSKKPFDRLTADAIAAEKAGMSYGKWKALYPHTPEPEEKKQLRFVLRENWLRRSVSAVAVSSLRLVTVLAADIAVMNASEGKPCGAIMQSIPRKPQTACSAEKRFHRIMADNSAVRPVR